MLDHLGIQVTDVEAATRFYVQVFAAVGLHEIMRFRGSDDTLFVGLGGPDGQPQFWLGPPTRPGETRELHIAFSAPDRVSVDAVHEAALGAGVEVLHPPREWPEYHPGYYAVFLRDLDGHNVEAVNHGE